MHGRVAAVKDAEGQIRVSTMGAPAASSAYALHPLIRGRRRGGRGADRATSSNENPDGAGADVLAGVGGRGQDSGGWPLGVCWCRGGAPAEDEESNCDQFLFFALRD